MATFTDRIGGVRSELAFKAPVRVATTAAITLSGFQTIDGVTLAAGDPNLRVLVKDQVDQTANGIYDVKSGLWTRAKDFDANGKFVNGTRVSVTGGVSQSGMYVVTTSDPIVVGDSAITFVYFSLVDGAIPLSYLDTSATLSNNSDARVASQKAVKSYVDAPRVATRTALASLSSAFHVAYLYETGREGSFVWSSTNHATDVTGDTQQGIYVPPASDTSGASGAWQRVHNGVMEAKWFGVKADGTTADDTALAAWFAQVTSFGRGTLPPGNIRLAADVTWAMPAIAPVIEGSGWTTTLKFDAGKKMAIQGATSSTAFFYLSLRDLHIDGNIAGVLLTVCQGVNDALNGADIVNIIVNNNSTNSANVGVVFNGLYTSNVLLTSNCSGSGNGTAIRLTSANMCKLQLAGGNSSVGLHLTSGGGSSVGGNVFLGCDFEVNSTNVLIDASTVLANTFLGGILTMTASGNVGIDATAGVGNEFTGMLYGGPGSLFHATAATHRVGIIFSTRLQSLITTPAFPATGVSLTNTQGQSAMVNISGGTVTGISINSVSIAVTTPFTGVLCNGDAIVVTYTGTPTWRWTSANV